MKNFKYVLPNALTLVNLLLGIVAIIMVFRGRNEYVAAWVIFAAALFDLFDGLAARALNAKSEFGKALDSLADMVSFGVAPTIILYQWLFVVLTELSVHSTFGITSANTGQKIILLCSLLFAVGGAIRLARFNATTAGERYFTGLPIPAAALFVAICWLLLGSTESESTRSVLLNIGVVFAIIVGLFALMVSRIRMIALKFDGLGIRNNMYQYIVLLGAVILIALFRIPGALLSMIFYILLSFIQAIAPAAESKS